MIVAPTEIEEGNIEYKRNFINVTNTRLNQLTAQMNWRINEGNGICYYYLGVCDNGTLYESFSQEEIDYSLDIIKMMADGCNAYIENIIINRININRINIINITSFIWLNITIRRKSEYMNEYRIECNMNIKKLIKEAGYEYKKSGDIYFNTIIHNNEKYLFFESKKKINKPKENIIDFNLSINNDFNSFSNLMDYVEKNITGNNICSDEIIFNIIKTNYIESVGYIISGFLKSGKIRKGTLLMSNKYNLTCQIISIHNNQIDCNSMIAPATISINILIIDALINGDIIKLDGSLIKKPHYQNEQVVQTLDLLQYRQVRRQQRRDRQKYQVHQMELGHHELAFRQCQLAKLV